MLLEKRTSNEINATCATASARIAVDAPVRNSSLAGTHASFSATRSTAHHSGRFSELGNGRYVLIKEFPWMNAGTGAGRVYRAIDRNQLAFSKDSCLSILVPPVSLTEDLKAFAALLEKTRAWRVLHHPHIVSAEEFRRSHEVPYLTMGALPGGSLAQRLKAGPLPLPQAMVVIASIGHALSLAHAQGLIHGCLSPAAIAIDDQARATLLDPGVVAMLGAKPELCTDPEVQGEPSATIRTDVHGFVCLAYMILTGEPELVRLPELLDSRGAHRFQRLPQLSAKQSRAFSRALAGDPAQRTPDVMTFLCELNGRRTRRGRAFVAAAALVPALLAGTCLLNERAATALLANIKHPFAVLNRIETQAAKSKHTRAKAHHRLSADPAALVQSETPAPAYRPGRTAAPDVAPVTMPAIPASRVEAMNDVNELLRYTRDQMLIQHYAGYDSAAEALLKILRLAPTHTTARQTLNDIVAYYAMQGRAFIDAHDWDRAHNMLMVAKGMDPSSNEVEQALLALAAAELVDDERPTIGGMARVRFSLLR